MQITLNTAESSTDELTALIALLASLGGRLPNNTTVGNIVVKIDADEARAAVAQAVAEVAAEQDDEETAEITGGSGGEVDSKGTPWDARIHSESKATVADGTWRKRRGVSDELFAEVMAELADTAPPPPPADEEVPLAPTVPADEQVPAPPAPTAETPSEPAPAASAPVAGDGNFPDFASFVAAVAKHGKTYAELNEMAGVVGVAAFKDLKDHADKWDMFFSMIG
jgi:hypothetical protein